MTRLDRTGVEPPADWPAKAAEALPEDLAEQTQVFEGIPINDPARRRGFRRHGSEALPLVKGRSDFPPLWRSQRYVKETIGKMSEQHCAYCQSEVDAAQYGDVDHFKPKSLFPSLAYSWENYFLSCLRCNRAKLDRWPSEGSYVRPDEGDPAGRFIFAEDGSISAARGDLDADHTVIDFDLDRKGLQRFRQRAIERELACARDLLLTEALSFEEKRRLFIGRLVPDLSRFSAAINQSLCRLWASLFPDDPL